MTFGDNLRVGTVLTERPHWGADIINSQLENVLFSLTPTLVSFWPLHTVFVVPPKIIQNN